MRLRHWIAWSFLAVLLLPLFVGSATAFVFTDLVAKVQRILMTSNQVAQITTLTEQLTELKGQYQHIKDASMGQIQALTQPFTDLSSTATGLVSDGMAWKSDFEGVPRDLATAVANMGSSGTSLTTTWSGWLEDADTVSENDIVQLHTNQPEALSDRAVEGWKKTRERADKRLVLDHAVAEAAAKLADALREAKDALGDLQNQTNVSDTALAQAQLAGSVTKGNLSIAGAQLAAFQAAKEAAEAYAKEERRRDQLSAWVAAQQAAQTNLQSRLTAIESNRDDMRQGLLLGVHPFYGDSYGEQVPAPQPTPGQ